MEEGKKVKEYSAPQRQARKRTVPFPSRIYNPAPGQDTETAGMIINLVNPSIE